MEILPLCETARYVLEYNGKKITLCKFLEVCGNNLISVAYSCKKLMKANANVG